MWSGTLALRSIDQTLQTVRNESIRLDSQLSNLTESLASNQRRRLTLINQIVGVRLSEIEQGDLRESLTLADRQALEVLEQRRISLQTLNQKIEQLNQDMLAAEGQREQLLERLNVVSQQIVDVEAAVQLSLKSDESYLSQFAQASHADSVSQEAERKVQQAHADMSEKAKPYQQDELFMYLWQRGYGTTEYKGKLFARFMDSWVARLIKFEPSRVNFWNLTEIPKRLTEHADRVAEAADVQHMALQQIELDALAAKGIKELEAQLEALRVDLDEYDDGIEDIENNLNSKLEDRARFSAGEDSYIAKCLKILSQALQHRSLESIHRYVLATTSLSDDQLVLGLRDLEDRMVDVQDDLRDIRALHQKQLAKLTELETVRRNFKNSRYDDVRSGFGNKELLTGVLGQFLQGVVSGSDVWKVIQRNQRRRNVGSVPDFGSDGLGSIGDILGAGTGRRRRAGRRSTWNFPQPRRGGSVFRSPGGGSRGRGGFKTGGGF